LKFSKLFKFSVPNVHLVGSNSKERIIFKIDNKAVHSAEEVKWWIVDCVGPASGTCEFFDVTSMLESLQDSGWASDNKERMDSQALSHKANHRSGRDFREDVEFLWCVGSSSNEPEEQS
jgi:hypothetical protein